MVLNVGFTDVNKKVPSKNNFVCSIITRVSIKVPKNVFNKKKENYIRYVVFNKKKENYIRYVKHKKLSK